MKSRADSHLTFTERRVTYNRLLPLAVAMSVLAGVVVAAAPRRTPVELVGLACACGCLALVPRQWLPSVALLFFALIPTVYLRGVPDSVGRYMSPAVIALGVLIVRALRERAPASRGATWWGVLSAAALLWLLESWRVSIEPRRSALWVLVFAIAVLGPGFAARRGFAERATLVRAWTGIALVLGSVGVLEGLTHINPLARFYTVQGVVIGETWSVYRIETTLGHPLLNGLFFATTAALMTMRAIERPTLVRTTAAALTAAALAFTASRSGVIAFVAATGLGVSLSMARRSTGVGKKVVVMGAAALLLVGVVNAPILKERERSSEASVSALYRSQVATTSLNEMRRYRYLGSGAGTSQILLLRDGQNPALENSVLQIGVSLGVPGLLAVGLIILTLVTASVRRWRLDVAAAIVAYVIAAAGFNPWDSDPQTFVLLGLLGILALAPDSPSMVWRGSSAPTSASSDGVAPLIA